ncbi:tetratricopeptide repeat protein [Geoalkalibacter sp.]|uniref:tetratricopeptide repeat protein n=1 Tax=Geoalkalibacter sp. TaxID=3041440 RepID=UPI00272E4173|nr:tetratricopeptide repeat protein [Geoalkalibacter sp.]
MSNKEKLIASAQKNLLKGQVTKAIKDYQRVVELDPKDIRNRQKLADLFVRAKMLKEAQEHYEAVARYFSENGFFLKAIAVYKQMQRLDPSRIDIYHRLAELNARQGLVGNSLAEYKSLVNHYEKLGLLPEAVNVLQKMKDVDPENLNIRVKIAETYARAGMQDKGKAEFLDILKALKAKRDPAKILKLFEIFQPLFPEDMEIRIGQARALIDAGDAAKGVDRLKKLLVAQPANPDLLRHLAAGLHRLGDFEGERAACKNLLELVPGDAHIREGYLRACLKAQNPEEALEKLELWREDFVAAKRIDLLKDLYEKLHEALPREPRVVKGLKSLYQTLGEGDKLLDIMAFSGDASLVDSLADEDGERHPPLPSADTAEFLQLGEDSKEELLGEEPDQIEDLPLEFLMDEPAPAEPVREEPRIREPLVDEDLELDLEFDGEIFAETVPMAATKISGEDDAFDGDSGELELIELPELLSGEPAFVEDLAESESVPTPEEGGADFFADELPDLEFDLEPQPESLSASSSAAGGATSVPLSEVDRARLDGDLHRFKKVLESQIDEGDAETHFNLGIAFKEMGLLDDAVAEFDQAMKNLARRLDSLALKGICLAEKGDLDGAEEAFKSALLLPDIAESDLCNLYFELGLLHEKRRQAKEALGYFERVAVQDPSFREVSQVIRKLRRELGIGGGDDKGRVSYL